MPGCMGSNSVSQRLGGAIAGAPVTACLFIARSTGAHESHLFGIQRMNCDGQFLPPRSPPHPTPTGPLPGPHFLDPLSGLLAQNRQCQCACLVRSDWPVSYTHLRAHETGRNLVCRLLLEKKKKKK